MGFLNLISHPMRETLSLRTWALLKIPMLSFVGPRVMELSSQRCVMGIPLNRRTRNHLGSMYFGVLCAGADCAGGLMAMKLIRESGRSVSLIFKDFRAEFLKRPEGDVLFTCEDGAEIAGLVERVIASGEREHLPVQVTATVPSVSGDEAVARFVLTLSLKARGDHPTPAGKGDQFSGTKSSVVG